MGAFCAEYVYGVITQTDFGQARDGKSWSSSPGDVPGDIEVGKSRFSSPEYAPGDVLGDIEWSLLPNDHRHDHPSEPVPDQPDAPAR